MRWQNSPLPVFTLAFSNFCAMLLPCWFKEHRSMEIQTPLPRRPCGKAEARRQNVGCPAPKPRENNFRVAARRQTAANLSTRPQFEPKSEALRHCASVAKKPSFRGPVTMIYSYVPVLTPLGCRATQKSPISRILPHPPAFTPGEGGIKCRILYSPASLAVGLCRNMSE